LEQDAKHVALLEEADEETIGLRVKARETLDALKVCNMLNGGEMSLTGRLDLKGWERGHQGSRTPPPGNSPHSLLQWR